MDYREEARQMLDEMKNVDMAWRSRERVRLLEYGILAGYQLALSRTLGDTPAFTQMLLGEVGDLLLEALEGVGVGLDYTGGVDSLGDLLKRVFLELGVAREVEVERLEDTVRAGRRLVRYRIVLKDSVFKPVHEMLHERGLSVVTLSPEALLAGAVLRRILREEDPRARVNVKTALVERDDEIDIDIALEEIRPLGG